MSWPLTSPSAPTLDSTLMAVPTSSTAVSANTVYLLGALFTNTTAATIAVTVTNTAGSEIIPAMLIPPAMPIIIEFPFLPCVGLKWFAASSGVKGQLWGY